jgi:hypothetical protein
MLMGPSLNLGLRPKHQQAQLKWTLSLTSLSYYILSQCCRQRFVYVYCKENGDGANSSDGAMSLCFFQYSFYGFNLSLKCTEHDSRAGIQIGVIFCIQ